MTDEEVTEVGERIRPSKLPKCVDQLYDRVKDPRNFRTVLAVGERIFSIYKHEQAGEPIAEVPELCERYDIGKTKVMKYFREANIRRRCLPPNQKVQASSAGCNHQAWGDGRNTSWKGLWQKVILKQFVLELNKI